MMIVDDAVPVVTKWDEMVAAAINAGMRSVTTNTRIHVPTSATKDVIGAMSAMRHAFKQHIIPQVNREFGLHLESGSPASGIEYRRDKVKHLLTNFNFLRDPLYPKNGNFSSPFFQHFMIDMLFCTPMKLWQYMDGLNVTFATAIAAALGDFWHGYHRDVDAKAENWRECYARGIELISLMQRDPARNEWLTHYQQSIVTRGQAELAPANQ